MQTFNLLQGRIYYESVGDYPAQSFFRVQNTSGAINVIQDLRQDNLRLNSYLVWVTYNPLYHNSVKHNNQVLTGICNPWLFLFFSCE